MADEDNSIGYLYSGWCQAALPHRRLPDSKGWQVQSGPVMLIVEPGMRPCLASEPVPVGVPYGSRARLILIYLQSEAIRTKSREIELGRSLRIWLGRLGISIGGPTSIPWRALMTQFGGGYSHLKHFKPRFLLNLRLAQAVYPDARLESNNETELILRPSKPPVAKLIEC